jgi:hypothetical protein
MKRRSLAVSLLFSAIALAQELPQFSGQWTREPGYTEMGSGWGDRVSVTQDTAKLIVEYDFFSKGDMQAPLKFVYALDGTPSKNTVMMGRDVQSQVSKAKWIDGRLVIVTAHSFTLDGKPMTSEVTQTLTLESPTSLVVETTRAGVLGGPATTNKSVYRKL